MSTAHNLLHRRWLRWLRYLLITTGTLLLLPVGLYLLIPTLLQPALNFLLQPYAIQVTQLEAARPSSTEWHIHNLELEGSTFTASLAELALNYDLTSLRQRRLTTVAAGLVKVTLAAEPSAGDTSEVDSWVPQTLNPKDWLGQLPWQQLGIKNLEVQAPQAQLHLQGAIEQSPTQLSADLLVLAPQTIDVDRVRFEYDENIGVSLQLLNQEQATPVALLQGQLQPQAVAWNVQLNLEPATARTLALLLNQPNVQLAGEVTANGSLAWPPETTLPLQELELSGSYAVSAGWIPDGQDFAAAPTMAELPLHLPTLAGTYELRNNRLTLAIEQAELLYATAGSQARCSVQGPLRAELQEPMLPSQIKVSKGLRCHLSGDRGQLDLVLDQLNYRAADALNDGTSELKLNLAFAGHFDRQKPTGKVKLSLQQGSDALVRGDLQLQLVSPLLLPPTGAPSTPVDLPWTLLYQPEQDLLTLQFAHRVKLGERVLSGFTNPSSSAMDVSHALLSYRGELQLNPTTADVLKVKVKGDYAQLSLVHPLGTPAETLRLRPLQGSVSVELNADKLRITGINKLADVSIPFAVRYNLANEQVAFSSEFAADLPEGFLQKTFANWTEPFGLGRGRVVGQLQGGWEGDAPMQFSAKLEHTGTAAHYEDYLAKEAAGVWDIELRGATWHAQTPQLTVRSLNAGLPMADLSSAVRIELADDTPILQFEHTQLALLGGQVSVPSASYDAARMPNRFELSVQGISVAELLALEGTDITGTGKLSGTLPISLSLQGVQVAGGTLKSHPPGGTIRVADSFTQGMGQPGLDFALRALNNFSYDALTAKVAYQESGDLDLGVSIEGRNPKVEAGRKIIYNLNIKENVPALLESLQADKQVTKQVEQRVNKGKK